MKFLVFIILLFLDYFSKKIIFEQIGLNQFVQIFSFLDIEVKIFSASNLEKA